MTGTRALPRGRVRRSMGDHGEPIAVKTARGPRAVALLAREAEMLRRLPPGLAPTLHGLARLNGGAALSTGWIDGPVLQDLPHGDWIAILDALADRLGAVHEAGIVHCDIAPRNILCAVGGPILLDWESARTAGQALATGASRSISLGWSHPDLVWGRGVFGARIDVWSLERIRETALQGDAGRAERIA